MKITVFFIAFLVILTTAFAPVSAVSAGLNKLTVIYTSNLKACIEPCG